MRIITVEDAETWAKVQAMGDFERKYKNGELWYFNRKFYYLSHLNLELDELAELNYFNGVTQL